MVIALCWYISFGGVSVYEAALVAVMGFAGAVIDSYLGAGVQALYYDPETKEFSDLIKKCRYKFFTFKVNFRHYRIYCLGIFGQRFSQFFKMLMMLF